MVTTPIKLLQHPSNKKTRNKIQSLYQPDKSILNGPPNPNIHLVSMKHRVLTRNSFNYTNHFRTNSFYKIHRRNISCLLFNSHNYARHGLRMSHPNTSHKRCILIFRSNLHTHSAWNLFLFPFKQTKSMSIRSNINTSYNSNCLLRIRTTVRTNIILRGYCNYRSSINHPSCRNGLSNLNLRRAFGVTTYLKSIFLPTFHHTNDDFSIGYWTFNTPS